MVVGVFAVFILGIVSAGGLNSIYDKAMRGHRLDFNFSIDMTIRDGFWQVLLGNLIIWTYQVTFYAGTVQKYISLSSISNIKKAAIMFSSGSVAFHFIAILIGIMVYAKYSGCDPLTSGQVSRPDQVIPFFVTENGQSVPGLSGIFIAALFSSGLSTLSATLNTLAATIYGDFISPFFSEGVLVPKEGYILKLLVALTGITCTCLTFFIDRVDSIIGLVLSLLGLTVGLSTGIFSLGMLFPRANSKVYPPFILFRLSFWYSSVMSFLMVIIMGLLVSWFTKGDREFIDPDLISPISRSAITHVRSGDNSLVTYSGGTLGFDKTTHNFEDSSRM
ncbi:hypothetical protein RI129_008351 [Pyrocoelia pectoralis]|uniref:Sodium-dependent multivitamin transporter n=1 Tax=Pyrocoelia pectoralis TaxID=417401 RepID=A0AAN7VF32_9COLE